MHRRLKLRGAFPKSVDEYTQPVGQLLQLRRAEMDEEWEKIEEGWAAINERMVRFGLAPRTDDESVVELDVGGSSVTVSWHLLAETEGFKDSILGALLEGVWREGRIPRHADGRIMLDESPTCIKRIIHAIVTGCAGSASVGLPGSSARSSVTSDETPYLIYTAYGMGLWKVVPTHPQYMKVNGGSTALEPFEIAQFSAVIRQWVGGSAEQLTLIYRATRDGFSSGAFKARCNKSSPKTVSLIRVSSGKGSDNDSLVGGYAVYPWGSGVKCVERLAPETFAFMLKDGNTPRKGLSKPIKWNPAPYNSLNSELVVPRGHSPHFWTGGLAMTFDDTSGSCTMQTNRDHKRFFPTSANPFFLAVDGKQVVEIEVYRCSTPDPPTATAPCVTKPRGDAPTDAEAHDTRLFGQSIAYSLMEERVVLNRAVMEMEAASARVSAAVGALEAVYGPSVAAGEQDAVVELSVRGTRMTTLRSTLQACPRSALATMFDAERWPAADKDKDQHGRRFIDCNPICFAKILDVLRVKKRASWSRGVVGRKQERGTREEEEEGLEEEEEEEKYGGVPTRAVLIKKADADIFGEAVNMYFPGCESFIMDLVHPA